MRIDILFHLLPWGSYSEKYSREFLLKLKVLWHYQCRKLFREQFWLGAKRLSISTVWELLERFFELHVRNKSLQKHSRTCLDTFWLICNPPIFNYEFYVSQNHSLHYCQDFILKFAIVLARRAYSSRFYYNP